MTARGIRIVVGVVLIVGSLAAGVWSSVSARQQELEQGENATGGSIPVAYSVYEGHRYVIARTAEQSIDHCGVVGLNGAVKVSRTHLFTTVGDFRTVASFTATETALYTITCWDGAGREATGEPVWMWEDTYTTLEVVTLVGCAVFVAFGLVLVLSKKKSVFGGPVMGTMLAQSALPEPDFDEYEHSQPNS